MALLQHLAQQHREELSSGKLKRVRTKKGVPPRPPGSVLPDNSEGIVVLEGLAATGLRSIRYALEVGFASYP